MRFNNTMLLQQFCITQENIYIFFIDRKYLFKQILQTIFTLFFADIFCYQYSK